MTPLKPFTPSALTEKIQLSAQVSPPDMSGRRMIEFLLEGDLSSIKWPETFAVIESRKDDLWKSTCLEAFFAESLDAGSPYFEVNCSPAGDWNLYSLSSYRQDLAPLAQGKVRLIEREGAPRGVRFIISVEGLPAVRFKVGLTAVVEHANGEVSYWALAHPGVKADFHDKRAFLLES